MKVALDARTMQWPLLGGVGRSLVSLVPRIQEEVDLLLLTDAGLPPIPDLPQVALPTPIPQVSWSWVQWSASRWLRDFPGVFHCPFYVLPARCPVPGVVTMHDISFETRPEWFGPVSRWSFRLQARRAVSIAKAVITVSEFVKADLVRAYDLDPDRVLVAGHGVAPGFTPDAADLELLDRLGIHGAYVVALGGATRRNLPVAIEAWRRARATGVDVQLVVVGTERPEPEPGLVYVGAAPDAEWAALLAGSAAFLYPTEYEGFGLPAVEALGAGTVVVAAPVTSLPEVLGDAAAWAERPVAEDVAGALLEVLADESGRDARRAASLTRAAQLPGWDDAAATHVAAYQMAAGS